MANQQGLPYLTTPDGVRLRSTRCEDCAAATFPPAESCPQCGSMQVAEELLPGTGVLWTWTSQSVRPKSPPYAGAEPVEEYRPFWVGYVQFPGGICVEGRLVGEGDAAPSIGSPMTVVEADLAHDAAGDPVSSYAFARAAVEGN